MTIGVGCAAILASGIMASVLLTQHSEFSADLDKAHKASPTVAQVRALSQRFANLTVFLQSTYAVGISGLLLTSGGIVWFVLDQARPAGR